MNKNIMLAGVGGQGIITASKIISTILFLKDFDVKKSEIHGLSQRGGSVTSQIRYGKKIYSPVVPLKGVDFMISLESMEVLRYLENFSKNTVFILNDFKFLPITVTAGNFEYPKNTKDILTKNGFKRVFSIDAHDLSLNKFGNIKFANSILLGMFSNFIEIDIMDWKIGFEKNIKSKFIEKNLLAFEEGRKITEGK
ncbi:MAG: indolepyruvate oxidoreductase subunit beta [Candidatus Muirbacterium halophilum]|nr:indolepyruvate oxidoreductase subunit beta [Candidatus Muirbacterium halophilum]MCK9476924.1 indolepyruvate oxidoreductase subunit beta [Candidatus Muirbacterium halophilum]